MAYNVLSRMNYQQRQAYRESRKAEIAEMKARKQAAAMTCQCCGRQIFAQRGKIAHHGYERPGYGWQTQSCMGALYLPFEVARERLADLIVSLQQMIADTTENLAKIKAEKVKLAFSIEVDCDPYWDQTSYRAVQRTRKNENRFYSRSEFEALATQGKTETEAYHAACREARANNVKWPTQSEALQVYFSHSDWSDLKAQAIRQTQMRLDALLGDLELSNTRFTGWKQTHTTFDKQTKEWRVKG